MGKVIKKKIQGMNWLMKTGLVLLLTLTTMVFMYEGWYKPKQVLAAPATTGFTNIWHSATALSATAVGNVTVPAGTNRMLVVAFSNQASSSAVMTVNAVTYGGQAMTSAGGDAATSLSMHTQIYYLKDTPAVMDNTARPLVVNITGGGTLVMNDVWYAIYTGVDQVATPTIQTYNSGTGTVTTAAFATGLVVPANGAAAMVGVGSRATALPTYVKPTNFTVSNNQNTGATGVGFVATSTTAGTDTASVTSITNAPRWSQTGIALAGSATGNLSITNGTALTTANAAQGSINNTIDSFAMAMSSGSGTVTSLTVTGDANFSATNIPTNGVKVWEDTGSTVGSWDATDVLVSSASTAISGNATTVTISSEAVSTTSANYIVTVDLNGAATLSNTFTATVSNAAGTGLGTVSDTDTTGKTLTVTAGAVLTVGQGTDPANANAPRSSSSTLDAFTLSTSSGAASVTTVTVTGSANFTATNVGTNGVKIYRDLGTIGTLDGSDVLLNSASPAIVTNATTITLTAAEAVSTTPVNYLVVVDVAAAATLAQTFTGTVSAVAQTGAVSVTDSDTTSATLTVTAAQTLTIGNGTDPASANIQTGNTATLNAFSLVLNSGTATVSTLTLAGSANFTTANIASAAVYVDNGVLGTYEAGTDTLVATSYGQTGTNGTITFTTPEPVTAAVKTYLIRVTATGGATLTQTFTGNISAATGSGIGTPVDSDTTSATLTIIAGPVATITSCGGCHGNPPVDGTARNTPAGRFLGDHGKHTAAPISLTCINCHVDNGTSPTGNDHQDGQIQIASPLRAVTGESYGQATHAVSNAPTFSSCTTYCHSQGTSKTSNAGETRTATASTPLVTATWATTTTTCASCHGNPPNYATGATTWGAAKANSHQGTTHAAQLCTRCHNSVTGPTTVTTGHADGLYTVAAANVGYTYAAAGGSCNATGTGCHNAASIQWGAVLGCIDCHNSAQLSPVAQALNAAVTSRPIMTAGFLLAQSHTRSRASAAATSQDCCVCHMEGITATGAKNTAVSPNGGEYHGNGYVELRDPDTGTTIKTKTHSGTNAAEGAWSADTVNDAIFVRFNRNLGIRLEAETAVIPGKAITNFQVLGGIMVNHCLKCHDSLGATAADLSSRVTGGTAYKPFGATVAANGTNQGVLDVMSQFASANRSQHPVLVKNNNGYTNTSGTRLLAPWNGSTTKTGTTALYGALMSCWDCHAPNGSTAATTVVNTNAALVVDTHGRAKTVAADAVELRGSVYLSSTTTAGNLCLNCHVVSGGTTLHGAGSAMQASGSNGSMTYFQNRCYFCHSGVETNAHAARPIGAGDVHGYSLNSAGGALAAGRGYAFIRRTGLGQLPALVGATAYTATCGSGTGICSQGMGTYTPGGKF